MPPPDLQNYITQSRQQGMTDDQIRQNLVGQGWQQTDLDQAFGIAPISPAVPQAPSIPANSIPAKPHTKIIIIILVVFVGLPILIWAGIAGYTYYKIKQGGIVIPSVSPSFLITPTPTNQGNTSSPSSGQKLCGNWPSTQQDNNYLLGTKYFSKITSSTSVNGMTIYPNSIKIIEINTTTALHQLTACAKSVSISDIINYYQGIANNQVFDGSLAGANKTFGSLTINKIIQGSKGILYIYDAGQGDMLLEYSYR